MKKALSSSETSILTRFLRTVHLLGTEYRECSDHSLLFLAGVTECNGNHLTYTATGPLESQGVPKSEVQDIKPGNYVRHKTLSQQTYMFTGLPPRHATPSVNCAGDYCTGEDIW
jgi:hypothetical protein